MDSRPEIPIRAENSGEEPIKRAERIVYPPNPRYLRMKFLSRLMDQSIQLPGGYRIGLDPIIGLIPAIGDMLTTAISLFLVYDAARLGLPKLVLGRMLANVALESLVGTFPILGDLFDAVWKSNIRNMRLLDLHYHPTLPERPARRLIGWLLLVFGLFIGVIVFLCAMLVQFFLELFRVVMGG